MSQSDLPNRAPSPQLNHNFWLTGFGGFVLGALTVILVLFLARQMGNHEPTQVNEPPGANQPVAEEPAAAP